MPLCLHCCCQLASKHYAYLWLSTLTMVMHATCITNFAYTVQALVMALDQYLGHLIAYVKSFAYPLSWASSCSRTHVNTPSLGACALAYSCLCHEASFVGWLSLHCWANVRDGNKPPPPTLFVVLDERNQVNSCTRSNHHCLHHVRSSWYSTRKLA